MCFSVYTVAVFVDVCSYVRCCSVRVYTEVTVSKLSSLDSYKAFKKNNRQCIISIEHIVKNN